MKLTEAYNVGDRVTVDWRLGAHGDSKRLYPTTGNVVQVTDKLLAFRCDAGFVVCVHVSDIVAGVEVKLRSSRKELMLQ
jgi:hypothetical protein